MPLGPTEEMLMTFGPSDGRSRQSSVTVRGYAAASGSGAVATKSGLVSSGRTGMSRSKAPFPAAATMVTPPALA